MTTTTSIYRTYKRIRGKAPICHAIAEALEREGFRNRLGTVSKITGVAVGTIKGWLPGGDTISPRVETAGAVIAGIGGRIEIVQERTIDLDKELRLAADWAERQGKTPTKKKRNGRA